MPRYIQSTPLLDWSEDYQVALWFASSSNDRNHKKYNNECVEDYDVSDDEFSYDYMEYMSEYLPG